MDATNTCGCCAGRPFEYGTQSDPSECPLCGWVPDAAQEADPLQRDGRNPISLAAARWHFANWGRARPDAKRTRTPYDGEEPIAARIEVAVPLLGRFDDRRIDDLIFDIESRNHWTPSQIDTNEAASHTTGEHPALTESGFEDASDADVGAILGWLEAIRREVLAPSIKLGRGSVSVRLGGLSGVLAFQIDVDDTGYRVTLSDPATLPAGSPLNLLTLPRGVPSAGSWDAAMRSPVDIGRTDDGPALERVDYGKAADSVPILDVQDGKIVLLGFKPANPEPNHRPPVDPEPRSGRNPFRRGIFRVFVSSTFADLARERDVLQHDVFPRVRAYCEARGAVFQPIDLRWGVSEEAGHDQRTMEICLDEIARCRQLTPRPNFIVLLGDRYGWRPLPAQIPGTEWASIVRLLGPERTAELDAWYERDDNAVPPAYILRPRTGSFRDGNAWRSVEERLGALLGSVADQLAIEFHDRLKYGASATEQEIWAGALRVDDADEHVHCFFRSIRGMPELSAEPYVDVLSDGRPDEDAAARLANLKGRLRARFGSTLHEYAADWAGAGPTDAHLDQLADDVYRSLTSVIESELARQPDVDPVEREIAAHRQFAIDASAVFVGRSRELAAVDEYLRHRTPSELGGRKVITFMPNQSDAGPCVVVGSAGSGKSSLLARFVILAEAADPSLVVVSRFLGTTPDSSSFVRALDAVADQIAHEYGAGPRGDSRSPSEAVSGLERAMSMASATRPLLVVLDAIDQFRPLGEQSATNWLPLLLAEHTKLVASITDDPGIGEELRLQASDTNSITLPAYPEHDAAELLTRWLASSSRTLQPDQLSALMNGYRRNRTPLFLRLAFTQAARWKSLTRIGPEQVGETTDALIAAFFADLASEHGHLLVERVAGLLAAARHGLAETELIDILSSDRRLIASVNAQSRGRQVDRLPVAVWSRLLADLQPYLAQRERDGAPVMAFFHRQFKSVAADLFLSGLRGCRIHRRLATYFAAARGAAARDAESANDHGSEVPFHLARGHAWQQLFDWLTRPDLIQRRGMSGRQPAADMERDVAMALENWPRRRSSSGTGNDDRVAVLAEIEHALGAEPAAAATGRDVLLQQLVNRIRSPAAERLGIPGRWVEFLNRSGRPWVRLVQPMKQSSLRRELLGHSRVVIGCGISPDGQMAVSAADGWGTIRTWDVATGTQRHQIEWPEEVTCFAATPDGTMVAVATPDATVKTWDVATGRYTDRGEAMRADSLAAGGRRAVSRVLLVIDGGRLVSLMGRLIEFGRNATRIGACAVSFEGDFAVAGADDGTLCIWDVRSLNGTVDELIQHLSDPVPIVRVIAAHDGPVWSCAISRDGSVIVSGGADGYLRAWDAQTGVMIGATSAPGFTGPDPTTSRPKNVTLAVSRAGATIVSIGTKGRAGVWRNPTMQQVCVLPNAGEVATACAVDERGWTVMVGSSSGLLRVHDVSRVASRDFVADDIGGEVRQTGLAVAPGETSAVTVDSGGHLTLWDGSGQGAGSLDGATPAQDVGPYSTSVSWHGEGGSSYVWTELVDGSVWRSDPRTRKSKVVIPPRGGEGGSVISKDGTRLMVWERGGPLILTSADGAHLAQIVLEAEVRAAAFLPDKRTLLVATADGRLSAVRASDGRRLASIVLARSVTRLRLAPDGSFALAVSSDRPQEGDDLATLVRLPLGRGARELGPARHAVVLAPGDTIVGASRSGDFNVWDARGDLVTTRRVDAAAITAIVAEGDGQLILICDSNRVLQVWSARDWMRVAELPLPADPVNAAFVDGGTRFWITLASGEVLLAAIEHQASSNRSQRAETAGVPRPQGLELLGRLRSIARSRRRPR